jgi:nicotinamide-nucleotide amidase
MMNTVPDDRALQNLARQLGEALHARHQLLVTAESCTGGWVAKVLTDIAGSSGWFDRGFVTYSNQAKHDMLGVPEDILEQAGAVSEPVVRAMARGALERSAGHYSLSISGIAGPGGATPDKPVGLVWFGWARFETGTAADPGMVVRSTHRVFSGDREDVRRQAVAAALKGVLDELESSG